MYGYMGRILRVDLTDGRLWDEPLDESYARAFVGGSGLAARYLADLTSSSTDPLGPDNPLIFMTGPLVGTTAPSSGRYAVVARSPQTGLTGEANSGGFFGPAIRQAGYDGLIITGQAASPVFLSILEGRAPELQEANALWGLDTYETQRRIRELVHEPRARVACIGLAGEHLVKYAAVMNDHGRAVARTGMGAVMGSKRLKALVAWGTASVPIADAKSFKAARTETLRITGEDVAVQMMRLGGTMFYLDIGQMYGDVPGRYFSQSGLPEAEETLNSGYLTDTILLRPVPCFRCSIACGREVRLERFDAPKVDGPEYETVVGFGPLLGSGDLEGIAYAGHLCNLNGLDSISTSVTIAFACSLFEKGIITPADTGGRTLQWGDLRTVHELIHEIARRKGFGQALADGALALGKRFGAGALAAQVKNLEVPMHDPRAFTAMAMVYAMGNRGADHMSGDAYMTEQGRVLPELGIEFGDRQEESAAKAEMTIRLMDWRSLTNSLILCHFEDPPGPQILGLINGVTGWNWDWADVARTGERIFTLKRMLNLRWGLTPSDDHLPDVLLSPLPDGGTGGYVPDMDRLSALYYTARGYDPESGAPSPAKLAELELSWLAPTPLTPSV